MTEKLKNLIDQLSPSEHIALAEHIERQYAVEFKDKKIIRDNIKSKVIELLRREFAWIEPEEINESHRLEKDFALGASDITDFTNTLLKEFDLEGIPFSEVMKWQTVEDIINHIEDSL